MFKIAILTIILNLGGGELTITMEHPNMGECRDALQQMTQYLGDNDIATVVSAKCEEVE